MSKLFEIQQFDNLTVAICLPLKEVVEQNRVKTLLNLKQKDIKSSSPCSACEIFDSCFGHLNHCWAEILKAYGDENWDYPDPRCIKAPKMKNNLKFE